jgi:hypothetical protein
VDPADRDESMRNFHRTVVAARHRHPALRADRVASAGASGSAVALVRGGDDDPTAGGETLLVAVNAATNAVELAIEVPELAGRSLVRVVASEEAGSPSSGDGPGTVVAADGTARLWLARRTAVVLEPR